MTELQKAFEQARQQWREDCHMKDHELIYKDSKGREFIIFDGMRVYVPYELTSKKAFREVFYV